MQEKLENNKSNFLEDQSHATSVTIICPSAELIFLVALLVCIDFWEHPYADRTPFFAPAPTPANL